MYSPIHRELGVPFTTPLDWQLLQKAVEAHLPEQRDLDFKIQPYNSRNPQAKNELAKDLCAMANSGGGWIILGIEEDSKGNAHELRPFEVSRNADQTIQSVARSMIQPPLLDLKILEIQAPSGSACMALVVPQSDYFPHLCLYDKHNDRVPFFAPVRSGAHTTYLNEPELRRMYAESLRAREQKRDEQKRLFDELLDYGRIYDGSTFVCTAFPTETAKLDVNREEFACVLDNAQPYKFALPRHDVNWKRWLLESLAPMRRAYRGIEYLEEDRAWEDRFYRCRLTEDGMLSIAIRLGGWAVGESFRGYPRESSSHVTQQLIEQSVMEAFTLLRAVQEKINPSDYEVTSAIALPGEDPLVIRATDRYSDSIASVDASRVIHHQRHVTTFLPFGTTDDELLTLLRQHALDHLLQGGIDTIRHIAQKVNAAQA